MSICLERQYCSTRYGQLITACSLFGQYVSTVVLGTDIHHGMFICLVRQCPSTRYGQLITVCSSFVQCLSTLVPKYSVQTLTTACLFAQYVSALVLGTNNSLRLVLYLVSALVRQYRSTRYRHSPRYVYLLSTLVPQYSVRTTHHSLFCICLVPQYVSTLVLGTDTHHGMFISQYVSTLVLGTDNSSRLVLHLFGALVRQYLSTRYRHSPRHVYFLVRQYFSTRYGQLITACSSFVWCASTLVPQYSLQTLTTACLFAQYVSTLVLGMDNSSRCVLHLFSALVPQYRNTRYVYF